MVEYFTQNLRELILDQARDGFVAAYSKRFARDFKLPLERAVSILKQAERAKRREWLDDSITERRCLGFNLIGSTSLSDLEIWFLKAGHTLELNSLGGQILFVLEGASVLELKHSDIRAEYSAGDLISILPGEIGAICQRGSEPVVLAVAVILAKC